MNAAKFLVGSAIAFLLVLGVGAMQPEPEIGPGSSTGTARRDTAPDAVLIGRDFRNPAHVLDDFHDAAAKADFARYFSHWTADSVFLGTDATERWVGDEFKAFARPHFEKGKGWTYTPRDRRITAVPGGEVAFFDELLTNEKLGTCRGSGVLRRISGEWKVLQFNLSIPIPNDKAGPVVDLIRQPG